MRLGIMGGTFDPIHYGHLFIAEEARTHFRLNHVLFVPNGHPPHKKSYPVTPARHRYAMSLIATHSNAAFSCSPVEMDRPGPCYTADTLALIRQQYPEAELFYITGIDAVADILTWNRHDAVIQMATFIAATRPGFDPAALRERLPMDYLARILVLGSTALNISSTDLRRRVASNLSIRYLTPDGVMEYIYKHHLYRSGAPVTGDASGPTGAPASDMATQKEMDET
ncbi:MAG: nicotinate-nucleotide adenylyltransferase [Chloroherpetonaceae bacterium]|nr:nicotinate-nucleotide adenylyltransferase [Chloroherpetonaceae bacterium]